MSLSRLVEAFPATAALTLVDVGSAGGIHQRWRPFAPIVSAVGFDPREHEPSGELSRGCTRIYPVALGEKPGAAPLYLTRRKIMSSILPPNRALLAAFAKKLEHTEILETSSVPVDTLDAIAARENFTPDVLKIDTQGCEGLILAGARDALERSLLVAEIEISFMERYIGQPLFEHVHARMSEAGFRLIDLTRLKRYRAVNRSGIKNVSLGFGQRAGSLSSADAIFLKNEATVLERARSDSGLSLARTIVALIAYGKPDVAARFHDLGSELLPPEFRRAAADTLRALATTHFGVRRLHILADRFARRI